MTCRHNWRRDFLASARANERRSSREKRGRGIFAVSALVSKNIASYTGYITLSLTSFFFIFKEPLSKSALYHAFNVCEVSRHIFLNIRTRISFEKMSLLIWPMTWFMVRWARCSQSNPIDFQSFDWLRLGSVFEPNPTHPKILPVRHNRTLKQSNIIKHCNNRT